MPIHVLTSIIVKIGIFLVSFYISSKSINHKASLNQKILLFIWCLIWTILNISNLLWMSLLYNVIYCAATIFFLTKVLKIKLDIAASVYMLSYGLSYFLYFITSMLITLIFVPFLGTESHNQSPVDFNNPVYILVYSIIASLQFIMARQLFKIKRFKDGFPFLFEKYTIIITLIITGIVMAIISIFSSPREIYDSYIIFIMLVGGIIIAGIGTIIWIRRGITRIYMKNLKEYNFEQLKQELLVKDEEIQRLNELIDVLQSTHHKIGKRLSAWENSTSKIVDSIKTGKYSTELGEKFAIALDDMIRLTQDYDNGISQINMEKPLPPTNIKSIDDMFDYYLRKYSNDNIEFNLQVNDSIPYLVENIIEQSDLETLIGDLLENALTAVKASDKIFRSVLAIIGVSGNYYEFTVFDSGIPFDSATLMRLGKERVTTHADTGGSGIGFMTTFETMKACGASLIINEKPPNERDYTKSVTVRFNGENRYLIESYRFGDVFKREEEYTAI